MKYMLLVPTKVPGIKEGSAVIGELTADPTRVSCSVEGNLYGASNLVRFIDKCLVAGYRLRDNAPSMGRMVLPADALIQVGVFDLERREITEITDPDALRAWAGDVGERAA